MNRGEYTPLIDPANQRRRVRYGPNRIETRYVLGAIAGTIVAAALVLGVLGFAFTFSPSVGGVPDPLEVNNMKVNQDLTVGGVIINKKRRADKRDTEDMMATINGATRIVGDLISDSAVIIGDEEVIVSRNNPDYEQRKLLVNRGSAKIDGNLDVGCNMTAMQLNVSGSSTFIDLSVETLKITKPDPSQPGKYDVGYFETTQLIAGVNITMVVWYPMDPGTVLRRDQPDLDAQYETFSNSYFSGFVKSSPFKFKSQLKALKDGPISADGNFPLAIFFTGGTGDAENPVFAYFYTRTGEHLASNGIVAVGFTRISSGIAEVPEISGLITYVDATSPIASGVNGDKTTLVSLSAGNYGGLYTRNGGDTPLTPDTRVKGLVIYEGLLAEDIPGTYVNLDVPFLCIGRDGSNSFGWWDFSYSMDVAVNANPRYYVRANGATHFGHIHGAPDFLEGQREASLASGSGRDPLIFPPDRDIVDPFGFANHWNDLDANGKDIFTYWAVEEFFIGIPPGSIPFEGLQLNYHSNIGVNSRRLSNDQNSDGYIDQPAYMNGNAVSATTESIQLESTITRVGSFHLDQSQYDTPGHLVGYFVRIVGGTGTNQARTITAWSGAPDYNATVSSVWSTVPDTTSVYTTTNSQGNGPVKRRLDGTLVTGEYLGHLEQIKIDTMYTLAFIKSAVIGDHSFDQFLTTDYAETLETLGVTGIRVENTPGAKRRVVHPPPRQNVRTMTKAQALAVIDDAQAGAAHVAEMLNITIPAKRRK